MEKLKKDYTGVRNLRQTTCPKCGKQLTNVDIKPPLLGQMNIFGKVESNFYGGAVTKFSIAEHECGQDMVLYLINADGGYRIHDVAITEIVEDVKTVSNEVDKISVMNHNNSEENQSQSTHTVSEDEEQKDVNVKTLTDIATENTDILAQAVKDGDAELAVLIIEEMNVFQIPKSLIAGGIPEIRCKNKGKSLSKDAYIDLVEDFIQEQAINPKTK